MSSRNKSRLYLAYWAKTADLNDPNSSTYHVGLLLCPKNPTSKDGPTATKFHATNKIEVTDPGYTGLPNWKFEDKKSFARTPNLAGCVLLGKLSSSFDEKALANMLETIPVPGVKQIQEGTSWTCKKWLLAALSLLEENGVIPRLPSSPETVWETGKKFVDSETGGGSRLDPYAILCVCDTSGAAIESEIPGYAD